MNDAQRIYRILADISLCNRIDDSDIRSIVDLLTGHCSDNIRITLDQCLGWLDDDISGPLESDFGGIEVRNIDCEQSEQNALIVPAWLNGVAS